MCIRVPTETGKLENKNGHENVMEHRTLAKKIWNLEIGHGILPNLLPNVTKFVHVLMTL